MLASLSIAVVEPSCTQASLRTVAVEKSRPLLSSQTKYRSKFRNNSFHLQQRTAKHHRSKFQDTNRLWWQSYFGQQVGMNCHSNIILLWRPSYVEPKHFKLEPKAAQKYLSF